MSRSNQWALRASSVVALRRDAVLMVLRGKSPFAGVWSFPGGRGKPGEDSETTARREFLEETGLVVGRVLRLGAFQPAPAVSPLVLAVFAARLDDGTPRAGDDALAAEFVPLAEVLARPHTAGAPGWIARALIALAEPPLL